VIREEALICEGTLIRKGGLTYERTLLCGGMLMRGGCRAAEGLIREGADL